MPSHLIYPRPEYPRPERQRGKVEGCDWLNLNGPWQFRFDGDRRGLAEGWHLAEQADWREQIIVPFCWESLAAWGEGDAAGNDHYYSTRVFLNPLEVTRQNHRSAPRYEVGWYRRAVDIPTNEAWREKRVILTVGAADFLTDCWCNGIHLGRHEGGYTPFEFDLTDALVQTNEGRRAVVVLRVEDSMDNREQPVGKQWHWYTTTSGIWQTVFIEPRSTAHISSFQVIPDVDSGTARFLIHCANTRDASVEVHISPPGAPGQTETLEVCQGVAEQTIHLEPVRLWDPNSPNLYGLELRLTSSNKVTDTVLSYFGLRKIDFEHAQESGAPAAIRLNGGVRYLRGALYQSYFPDGVYTASSVDVYKDDIQYAKKAGFNFLRVHIKVDDPMLYYWADKLGILLMADFPNFGEGGDSALSRARFEAMLRETIERDFNHPSIFAWCLFNETWGFGGQTSFLKDLASPPSSRAAPQAVRENARQPETPSAEDPPKIVQEDTYSAKGLLPPQKWVQHMWELGKKLDSTRLVEDMSVCHWDHLEYYLHCDTDINSWHFYISDYEKAKAHIEKVVSSTFIGSSFNYVPGFLHKGQPLISSEYGGVGALDGDVDMSWSFKFLTNELRRYQQISAYIYTELHDVEWEYNGFLNYDRTPKEFGYDPRAINESNALPIDSPPVRRVGPGQIVSLNVSSSHYSTRRYDRVRLHWDLGGIDTCGRAHQGVARGSVPIAFPHRKVELARTLELKMPDTTMLCTLLVSARTYDGQAIARNFVHFFVSPGYPAAREDNGRVLILRGAPADWSDSQWEGSASERTQAHEKDMCWGFGHGFFEWSFPLEGADLSKAHRLKVLCEASSHRIDSPQTDDNVFPTTLQLFLNDIPIYHGVLRNHPHDSRGILTYLRGGVGAYGYLVHAFAEKELLAHIAAKTSGNALRLRCVVPNDALAVGGLTLYGTESGRFPVCPTVIVDW